MQGYHVLEAANGVEALRIWDEHPGAIDLLLTDMVMPAGISGRELAERLQQRQPGLRVVFSSGYSQETAGRDIDLLPGHLFLQKPYPPQSLLQAVRRILDTKRAG
ncbi:MAG: response regulator [Gemmatimonadaceae bacterium]